MCPAMTVNATGEVRQKRCAQCGAPFACCAGGCWCDDIAIDAATRARLRERYSDCLCAICLKAAAVGGPDGDGEMAPH